MKKKIKVANILEEGFLGGPQKRVVFTSKYLSQFVTNKVIIPKNNSSEFKNLLKENKIDYQELNISKLSKNLPQILKYILTFVYEILVLRKYFINNQFDIIHISGGVWQIKGLIAGEHPGLPTLTIIYNGLEISTSKKYNFDNYL